MLTYYYFSAEHKLSSLKMWNEFVVLRKAKKIPKPGFFDSQFNKWLYKATLWH
jgi:hypothetical protein